MYIIILIQLTATQHLINLFEKLFHPHDPIPSKGSGWKGIIHTYIQKTYIHTYIHTCAANRFIVLHLQIMNVVLPIADTYLYNNLKRLVKLPRETKYAQALCTHRPNRSNDKWSFQTY